MNTFHLELEKTSNMPTMIWTIHKNDAAAKEASLENLKSYKIKVNGLWPSASNHNKGQGSTDISSFSWYIVIWVIIVAEPNLNVVKILKTKPHVEKLIEFDWNFHFCSFLQASNDMKLN